VEYHHCIHFELSYYQAIDYAIQQRMKIVEAGAQGEHKIERGYIPVATYSAHHIAHSGLARAVSDFLERENHMTHAEISAISHMTPFRQT